MKYANQINLFLAITGCIAVLWVFSQTYLRPSPFENLDITEISGSPVTPASTQVPAAYQAEGTTDSKAAVYGNTPERPRPSAAGGGSLRPGSSPGPSSTSTTRRSNTMSQALRAGTREQAVGSSSSGRTIAAESDGPGSEAASGTSGPANVGGFSTPPAGQALGMEQAKRTPEDSSSKRKYVPFRSSMANRPN